ncbi:MAG TPA: amidohydrolase family protein, partial [Clostridiales bacterium]|nr:amidohydrolase family protein [Clostridiales bacterium]
EAGLSLDGYTTQFIADLRHLPVGLIKLIYKAKGPDRAYAITDGLEFSASDMKEGEIYTQENDLAVVYEDGVMKLADRSSLAGSVATCADLVRNMYKKCDISLVDSVKMASTTPARVVGFGHRKGLIKANYDADLVIFDDDVNIKAVVTNGNIIVNKI